MSATIAWLIGLLVAIGIAAWRPVPLQTLITGVARVLVAPVVHTQQVLTSARDSLAAAARHLALFQGAPAEASAIVEHHFGVLVALAFFGLALPAEWILVGLVLEPFFGAGFTLPTWLPDWFHSPESATALSLLCAAVVFGIVLFDVAGVTHVWRFGVVRPVARSVIGIVSALGLAGCLVAYGLLGDVRMELVFAPLDAEFFPEDVVRNGKLVVPLISILLGAALVFTGAMALSAPKTAGLIAAGVLWAGASALLLLLGIWNALVNAIHLAALQSVTWSASLFRRDADGESWRQPLSTAPRESGYEQPTESTVKDASPSDPSDSAVPSQAETTQAPASPHDVEDNSNWRAF